MNRRTFLRLAGAAGLTTGGAESFASETPVTQSPDAPHAAPVHTLSEGIRDPRVRAYLLPKRIVWQSESGVENPDHLLKPHPGQVTLDAHGGCTLRNTGQPSGILLDFGKEHHGGVQIMVSGTSSGQPVRVRVRFGESVSEAMSDLGGPTNATNDHAVRDQTCLVPWLGTHEIGNTAFRFVRVDLVEPNATVLLKSIRTVFLYRDLPYLGSFSCNDERLNRIWQTGAYTVHLNMQDYLWDGAKRDRLVWVGDMHPETMTISTVFGAHPIVPASLDLIREETPLPNWMNGISSYSLWWIIIHEGWYRYHGNLAYLKAQQEYLTGLVRQLLGLIGPDGREALTGGRFLDWPSSGNEKAIDAGLQSLMIIALEAASTLAKVLDDKPLASQCKDGVKRLRRYKPDHGNSKQAAALLALSGQGDPAALNRDVMAVDGAHRMSTFYGYYVLTARALAGDVTGCLHAIRDYWGAMLDVGATTFWEDFDLDWLTDAGRIDEPTPPGKKDLHGDFGGYCYKGFRHSLCHGWSSGPTAWLSEHVLGIRAVSPGRFVIRPALGDLAWVEGSLPTPAGVLTTRSERQSDGSVTTTYSAPRGLRVTVETGS